MEQEMELNIGERLRALRNKHGLSQRALARKASVTNGIISLIEQNRTSPSVSTLKKILDAFPISLSDFFTFGLAIQDKIVYTSSELVEIGGGGFSYKQVGGHLEAKALQILHETIEPGADSGGDMLRHNSEEGGVVIRGRLELTVGLETWVLEPGDAYYFDSRIPHRFRNPWDESCEVVSACTPPSF